MPVPARAAVVVATALGLPVLVVLALTRSGTPLVLTALVLLVVGLARLPRTGVRALLTGVAVGLGLCVVLAGLALWALSQATLG